MRLPSPKLPVLAALALAVVVATVGAAPASADMQSTKIRRHLCETVGGGKFVEIPGYPGEYIDRRLIPDIRWMKRNFDIFITDGYSTSSIHSPNGEHPIGLALDIVPYWARGGNWDKIDRLAEKTEPRQNDPKPPWRWVGYDGDVNHGRGHHLHLSYMHSYTPPRDPARVVYTRRCPEGRVGNTSTKMSVASSETSFGALETEIAPVVPEPGY